MNLNINLEDVDEVWTLHIKGASGVLTRFTEGKQVNATLKAQRLGEILMYLRAPMQELSAKDALIRFDALPDWLKPMYQVHGNRPVQMWADGFHEEEIAERYPVDIS